MDQWYASIGGQKQGPVPFDTLRQWVYEGHVTEGDSVWSPDMPNWMPAGLVPGLFTIPGASRSVRMRPHRGSVVLVLGILGLTLCVVFGIVAWVMGNKDLDAMRRGKMDPSGRGLTQAGRICGIISLVWTFFGFWILFGLSRGM